MVQATEGNRGKHDWKGEEMREMWKKSPNPLPKQIEEESRLETGNRVLRNKSYGFYVTLVLIAATVAVALVYTALYHSSRYMSWTAMAVMLVGAALSLVLALTPQAKWACAVLALANFVGLLFYIYGIYFYVSVVMVGIQASTFNWQFQLCTVLFVAMLVLNLVNVFLKQVKDKEA